MKTSFRLAAALAVMAVHCSAEIDLTPRQVSIGGGLLQRTHFEDGEKKFAITIDSETEVSCVDRSAVFRFKGLHFASMTLRVSPVRERLSFDGNSADYVKAAQALLPPTAASVVVESQVSDVLPINGWQSFRVTFAYTTGQGSMKESITFLNLDAKQQIVIKTGAKLANFDAMSARADGLMRRWHEVLPGDENGDS